jgi:NAD(P)-dependent dehydrogenase (short-subunit alcohol dehydrogenase family)
MDRVVAVTGAFGNLGSHVVRALAGAGAKVAGIDRDAPSPALRAEFEPTHLLLGNVDLTDLAAARLAFDEIVARYGRVDTLINIAGGFAWETFEDGDLATWQRMFDLNLKTAITASKAALPQLLKNKHSRIVNIGAGAAARGELGKGAYAASKAGVQRFTESLSEELKDRGATVNAVLPGIIDTPQNRKDMPQADFGRWVTPDALADVIVFLVSDAARAITGAAIPVFGRG